MREPTEYRNLKNRCPHCGHRLSMIRSGKCSVVTEQPVEKPCNCTKYKVK